MESSALRRGMRPNLIAMNDKIPQSQNLNRARRTLPECSNWYTSELCTTQTVKALLPQDSAQPNMKRGGGVRYLLNVRTSVEFLHRPAAMCYLVMSLSLCFATSDNALEWALF